MTRARPGCRSALMVAATLTAVVLLLLPAPARTCEPCADYDFLCCDIPADNLFFLTSFSGEGMACGGYADGTWYYSTSWVRWYCDARLAVTNPGSGECVVVEVADAGPAAWVEELAEMPLLDASPLVCSDLFDSGSCGWSDGFLVEVIQVADDTPLGPGNCPGALTCETTISAVEETIIDDDDACFSRGCLSHGNYFWNTGTGYDGDALFTYGIDEVDYDCWGRWDLVFEAEGTYTISVHIPEADNRTVSAEYEVAHGGSTTLFALDQSGVSGWHELGEADFSAGGDQWILLTDRTGEDVSLDRKVLFDAISVQPSEVEPDVPPDTGPEEPEMESMDMPDMADEEPEAEPDADGDTVDTIPDQDADMQDEPLIESGCGCRMTA